jgi:hypothetical protein
MRRQRAQQQDESGNRSSHCLVHRLLSGMTVTDSPPESTPARPLKHGACDGGRPAKAGFNDLASIVEGLFIKSTQAIEPAGRGLRRVV